MSYTRTQMYSLTSTYTGMCTHTHTHTSTHTRRHTHSCVDNIVAVWILQRVFMVGCRCKSFASCEGLWIYLIVFFCLGCQTIRLFGIYTVLGILLRAFTRGCRYQILPILWLSMNLVDCIDLSMPIYKVIKWTSLYMWLWKDIARNCRLQLSKPPIYMHLYIISSKFNLQYRSIIIKYANCIVLCCYIYIYIYIS